MLKEFTHLPIEQLREAPWNPNYMEPKLMEKLKNSIERFGLMGLLVVRPLGDGCYEVLSGNHGYRCSGNWGRNRFPAPWWTCLMPKPNYWVRR